MVSCGMSILNNPLGVACLALLRGYVGEPFGRHTLLDYAMPYESRGKCWVCHPALVGHVKWCVQGLLSWLMLSRAIEQP